MIVLQAAHIYKSFGGKQLLKDATLTIQEGERIGLVGRNGAGKSTLLKIITGQMPYDDGQVFLPQNVTIGYLAQDGGLQSGLTVWDDMLTSFSTLLEQEKKLRKLEIQMGLPEAINNPTHLNKISDNYTNLREAFKRNGGYEYQAAIRSVLHGLQFDKTYYNAPVERLSGGEKTRLALAKLLLLKPTALILDEPTNYLDMNTMDWLEKYLQTYPGAILAVSHDRYFLDNIVKTIYELEFARTIHYNGNYSRYLNLKEEELERQAKMYRKQQEEKARLQEFVQRNIARASTTGRAQSKLKLLEKIKPLERPVADNKKINLSLDTARQSGKEVIKVKELCAGYHGKSLVHNVNFDIYRGERVALLGSNGIGKTTLLKTVAGILPPMGGNINKGYHITIDYYEQEQKELTGNKQVLNEIWDIHPHLDEHTVRSILSRFLFSGEDVLKNVGNLSGGEKSRLALAKLICSQANFLLLDEPTSHLDILSNEALEEALLQYQGTMLFVSHDRYFINKIATRIIELTSNGIIDYKGNFDYYQRKKAESVAKEQHYNKDNSATEAKKNFLQRKEIQREERKKQRRTEELEKKIQHTEKEIASLEKELYHPEVYNDHETYRQTSRTLDKLRANLEEYLAEWVELAE